MKENRTVLIGRKIAAILDEDGRVPPDVIELHSHAFVDPFEMDPELIFIEDIAYHLARIARFGGAADSHVAEHCLIVYAILKARGELHLTCLHGLLHDAHEYVLGDVVSPARRKPEYAFFNTACNRAQRHIYGAFDLPWPTREGTKVIKEADSASAVLEARQGGLGGTESWSCMTQELMDAADEFAFRLDPRGMSHEEAEAEFLRSYYYLRKEAGV